MTSLLRPIHFALAGFVVLVFGASAFVLATASTSGEPAIGRDALLLTATFVRDRLYDEATTPVATPPPVIFASPAGAPPLAAMPDATPVSARTCEEVRADGSYLDDAERDFFLANCITTTARATPSRTQSPAEAEAERTYRVRAASIAFSSLTELGRFSHEQLLSDPGALIDYGGRAGGWANQMESFKPVPARFGPAQDRLQVALWEVAAHTRLVAAGQARIDDAGYQDQLVRLLASLDAAIGGYIEAVGLTLPSA